MYFQEDSATEKYVDIFYSISSNTSRYKLCLYEVYVAYTLGNMTIKYEQTFGCKSRHHRAIHDNNK